MNKYKCVSLYKTIFIAQDYYFSLTETDTNIFRVEIIIKSNFIF